MILKIKVSPDGKEVTGLYSDNFPWAKLGKLKIERASDVFFNPATQKWGIRLTAPGALLDRYCGVLPDKFNKRKDAIAHEIAYLQGQL